MSQIVSPCGNGRVGQLGSGLMRQLADLSMPEVSRRLTDESVIVLPVGAVEAHGPHLPLATDLIVATAAVDALMTRFGDEHDLWALPPLAFTKSNEHAWAPGTVWLSARTMLAVLDDIGRSLLTAPTRTLVFVNAHGGNSALLQVACRDLRLAHGLRTFLAHPFKDTGRPSELGMGIHGGHDETSILLHLRGDLVDMAKAVPNVPSALAENRFVKWGGAVSFGWLSNDFGPTGVIGDPLGANAEHGAALWKTIIDELGAAMAEVRRFPNNAAVSPSG